jgi:PAS domain S-box-containing protein
LNTFVSIASVFVLTQVYCPALAYPLGCDGFTTVPVSQTAERHYGHATKFGSTEDIISSRPTKSGNSISLGLFFYNAVPTGSLDNLVSFVLFLALLQSPEHQTVNYSGNETIDGFRMIGWVFMMIALTAGSLLLLFRIKKKQTAQPKLDLMQKELMALYDQAPCGYHSTDSDGMVININSTLLQWLGYERNEVIGKMKFVDFIDGERSEAEENIAYLLKFRSSTIDLQLIRKSGDRLPVVLGLMPSEMLTKDPGKLLFSTVNNTRCHEALERIKTLDQELEAFSYSISHDLRAPLRSIDGYSRILQEDYAGRLDDEGRRVLGVVMNNAKRMGKLIDDLLDFGRLGRKSLQQTNVDMTALVNSIIVDLRMQHKSQPVNIHTENLLPAYADADMIRQVWVNVLENAVKFTGKKESPSIHVRSYKAGDSEICYEVKDNGVGFDMQYADKLFGVFQRLHKMQDFSGTGVGLAIVKRIIHRHGGRVWAEAALNQGATFYFTLPIEHDNK